MYDPRSPPHQQFQREWKTSNILDQAVAIAHLALAMAEKAEDKSNLLIEATAQLKNAHLLLRRAFHMVEDTPLDELEIAPERRYSYNELCSGLSKELTVRKHTWKPLAKEGSAFRKLLQEYAIKSVAHDLQKQRNALIDLLCDIKVSFDDTGEDQRGWLIHCISDDYAAGAPHIGFNEACHIVNTACRRIPKDGKRTTAWAEKMVSDGQKRIATARYKNWIAKSKGHGLAEDLVISLISLRNQKDNSKGRRHKNHSGLSS